MMIFVLQASPTRLTSFTMDAASKASAVNLPAAYRSVL